MSHAASDMCVDAGRVMEAGKNGEREDSVDVALRV